MVTKEDSVELITQKIIKTHLELTALIQDIHKCIGPLEYLNELNTNGRGKIATFRSHIEHLADVAERERDKTRKSELLSCVENYKAQLSTATSAFRKANVASACAIDQLAREDLLSLTPEQQNILRQRKDKQDAAKMCNRITEQLLDISKHLAETTQRSADTLDTLVSSSDKVHNTRKELEHQQQVIVQSGKLLGKYGRRELTDKALLILAFIFYLTVVFYILQKRLF